HSLENSGKDSKYNSILTPSSVNEVSQLPSTFSSLSSASTKPSPLKIKCDLLYSLVKLSPALFIFNILKGHFNKYSLKLSNVLSSSSSSSSSLQLFCAACKCTSKSSLFSIVISVPSESTKTIGKIKFTNSFSFNLSKK